MSDALFSHSNMLLCPKINKAQTQTTPSNVENLETNDSRQGTTGPRGGCCTPVADLRLTSAEIARDGGLEHYSDTTALRVNSHFALQGECCAGEEPSKAFEMNQTYCGQVLRARSS